jgi:hypothetical protein
MIWRAPSRVMNPALPERIVLEVSSRAMPIAP